MRRIFHLIFGALAMLAIALLSAFLSMRLAIHGREVEVPNVARLTLREASRLAASRGLRLSLQDRFYSSEIPSGRVLAQSPAPGIRVRRDWAIRVTESLGTQHVSIPALAGQSERPASIALRRLGLETGNIAHLPVEETSGIILAQTPLPGSESIERPVVSLLLSDPETVRQIDPVVMPYLNGLTLTAAAMRTSASGLHIASAEDIITTQHTVPATSTTIITTSSRPASSSPYLSGSLDPHSVALVVAQSPAAGYRVLRGAAVHITLAH